ncbi:MAG: hypothetical protein U1E65_20295 [Myxococcota bacterium]
MFSLIFDGLASLFVDLTVHDEEAKKAAKAAVHAAAAGMGAAFGDLSGLADAAVAGVRGAGEVAKLSTHDQQALGIIDSVVNVAGTAAGSAIEGGTDQLCMHLGATAAGGAAGAAAGGEEGFKLGLSFGGQLGSTDVSKGLEKILEKSAEKAAGMVAGMSVAAAVADPKDRAQAMGFGLSLGSAVGAAGGDLHDGLVGADAEEAKKSLRAGVKGLALVGASVGGGAILHEARGKDGRSTLDAMQTIYGLGSTLRAGLEVATGEGASREQVAKVVVDAAHELASVVEDETLGKRAREARREAEVWGDALHAEIAERAAHEHQAVQRGLEGFGDVSLALDLGVRAQQKVSHPDSEAHPATPASPADTQRRRPSRYALAKMGPTVE